MYRHTSRSLLECWSEYFAHNSHLTHTVAEFDRLRELCISKPLRGTMVTLQRVPQSKTIQVYNIGKVTKEILALYFENKGGTDSCVSVHRQDDYALVEYENCTSK